MSDVNLKLGVEGQAEVGKQINDAATKVGQTTQGMTGIIQKANQYYQNLTQSKNQQEQKDQQHHRKELERIQKEVEARKVLLEETEKRPATSPQEQAKRTLQIQSEQRAIEQLERQAQTPYTPSPQQRTRGLGGMGIIRSKGMRIGGAVAGLMGAYSLFSKIGGGLSEASEQGDALANAMLTMPEGGRGGGFSAARENIFGKNVTETVKELGQVALITGKDMRSMIEAMRETGDLSEKQSKIQIQIANEARRMAVDPAISGKAQVDLMRAGIIGGPSDYLGVQQSVFGTKGMSHRAEEMLTALSETLLATTHGPTGAGGGNVIRNLLSAFNLSGMPMYKGARGGQLLQSLDQAFRGGGDENFELFQYQALSPTAQAKNRALRGGFKGTKTGKLGSGLYDAYLADLAQSMGAFATTESMQSKLTSLGMGDIAKYFGEQFQGGETNIERTMQTFSRGMGIKLGSDMSSAQKVQFATQFSKSIGMEGREMDMIAFMNILLGDKDKRSAFLAEGQGLSKSDQLSLAKAKQEGDQESINRIKNQKTIESIWQKIGEDLDRVIVDNKEAIIKLSGYVVKGSEAILKLSDFLTKGDDPFYGMDPSLKEDFLASVGKQPKKYRESEEGVTANRVLLEYIKHGDIRMFGLGEEKGTWRRSAYERKKPMLESRGTEASQEFITPGSYGAYPLVRGINEGLHGTKEALNEFKTAIVETKREMQQKDKSYFGKDSKEAIFLKSRGLVPDEQGKTP